MDARELKGLVGEILGRWDGAVHARVVCASQATCKGTVTVDGVAKRSYSVLPDKIEFIDIPVTGNNVVVARILESGQFGKKSLTRIL
jgi:hypothetical protein